VAGAVVGVLLLVLCAFLAWRHRARWLPSLVALAARRRRALAAVQRRLRRARADPLGIEAEEFRVLQEAARVAAAEGLALGEAVLRVLRKQASLPAALLQALKDEYRARKGDIPPTEAQCVDLLKEILAEGEARAGGKGVRLRAPELAARVRKLVETGAMTAAGEAKLLAAAHAEFKRRSGRDAASDGEALELLCSRAHELRADPSQLREQRDAGELKHILVALDAAGFSGPDGLLYTRGSSMDDGVDTTEERLGKLADALDTGARHSMAGGGGGGGVGLGWKDGVVRQAEVPPGVPPPVFFALQEAFGHRAQAAGHRPPPAEVLSLGKRLCEAHDETTAVLAEAERLSTALVPEDSVTVSHGFGRASLPLGRASLRVSAARDSIGTEISGMSEASDEYVGADARVRLQPPPLRTPVRNVPRWPQLAMNVLATVEAVESLYQGEVDAGALRPDRLSVALANEGIDAAAADATPPPSPKGARRRPPKMKGAAKVAPASGAPYKQKIRGRQ
jgi:hypothetical protein